MTAFSYLFGMAMSLALAVAIGTAWTRDHRRGVWTMRSAAMLLFVAALGGLALGWALDHYFQFIAFSGER